MGIIGVVAALTLPNLNSSTGNKEKVAKVKKIHSNLEDALGRAQTIYGPIDEWEDESSPGAGDSFAATTKRFTERMSEFLKISKDCGVTNTGCFAQSITGGGPSIGSNTAGSVILADGTSVAFSETYGNFEVWIDIDGLNKGSKTYGNDIFYFKVNRKAGYIEPNRAANFSAYLADLKSGGNRKTASGWISDFDNADYLQFDSNGKCKNGTTPTETSPRCK